MGDTGQSRDQAEESAREIAQISAWANGNLPGTVASVVRQRRWRPVWRVDMAEAGGTASYLFKGTRAWEAHPYPLEYEMRMLEVLAAHGVPVPPLRGYCADPRAIVMEWMPGGRDPGLVMEAAETKSVMTADRWAASLRYMEILADMHRIPAPAFAAAGCAMPEGAQDVALNSFERFYAMYVATGIVDPMMEFCAGWLRRNAPGRTRTSFVTGDCGQFLSDGPDVTCVLDMEVGYLGDHLHDLACFRGRHPVENMGDLPALFRHYEAALGEPLDLDAIAYHTIVFLCIGYFAPLFALPETRPGGDFVESAVQVAFIGRRCFEALAEILEVALDEIALPAPRPSPLEEMALAKLGADLRRLSLSETFAGWQRGVLASVPDYLASQARYRRWAEDADLDEIETLLGERPGDMAAADRALDAYVRGAAPEQDAALVRLFHRRLLRQCLIIAGPDAADDHIALMKVEPILDGRMDGVQTPSYGLAAAD